MEETPPDVDLVERGLRRLVASRLVVHQKRRFEVGAVVAEEVEQRVPRPFVGRFLFVGQQEEGARHGVA